MSSSKVWFVTGASSGFGRALTELALKKGDSVVATLRKPEVLEGLKSQYPSDKLLVLKLDVSDPQQIADAFAKAKGAFGRLDIVYNNAAYGIVGEIEGTPNDVAKKQFDVNFWGAANVSREAVKFFREVNKPGVGGRLLNVSSQSGLNPSAGLAYYGASKFALEGFTQALAAELDPEWNIKVTLIVFGGFRTEGISKMIITPVHPAYHKSSLAPAKARALIDNIESATMGDPHKAIEKVYELAELSEPPLRLPLGKDSIRSIRTQVASVTADTDKFESWSEGLGFD